MADDAAWRDRERQLLREIEELTTENRQLSGTLEQSERRLREKDDAIGALEQSNAALSTRLQVHPERRINYAESSRSKQTRRSTKNVQPSNSVKRERTARVITGAVVKAKAESRMAPKPSTSEKNIQPEPEECLLCREMEESPSDLDTTEDACLHFRIICNERVKHMLETKVAQRQLGDVKLECPFPECDYMSDFKTLRRLVDEVAFKV